MGEFAPGRVNDDFMMVVMFPLTVIVFGAAAYYSAKARSDISQQYIDGAASRAVSEFQAMAEEMEVPFLGEIPIEERGAEEVSRIAGRLEDGRLAPVDLLPQGSRAVNYAFDVTPARLVTGLITERGVCPASETGICALFPAKGLT